MIESICYIEDFFNIDLAGPDGNAIMILGRTERAIIEETGDRILAQQYMAEATQSDYANLLKVTHQWLLLIQLAREEVADQFEDLIQEEKREREEE